MGNRHTDTVATIGRGVVMGAADVVPGVSGGTMALLLGIYDRFIGALAALEPRLATLTLGCWTAEGRAKFRAHAHATDLAFLLQLGIGIGLAILAGAHLLGGLIERYPQAMMAFFFGLIVVSARLPWQRIDQRGPALLIPLVLGAAAAAALALLPPRSADPNTVLLLAAGAFAVTAMLLPGVSGSALLVLIGVYPVVLAAVRTLDLVRIGTFGIGALLGLVFASRGIRTLLRRHADATHAALTGLMLGSVVRVWPWRDTPGFGEGTPVIAFSLTPAALIVIGAALSFALERIAGKDGEVGERQPEA